MEGLTLQPSTACRPPSQEEIESIINYKGTALFVEEVENEIVATLSMALNEIPIGNKVWTEEYFGLSNLSKFCFLKLHQMVVKGIFELHGPIYAFQSTDDMRSPLGSYG